MIERISGLREVLLRDPVAAAQSVLGWRLVHGKLIAQIVETEAYCGQEDPGSHAFRGETHRTRAMFGPPGHAYVYFTYGNHWMVNVTCRERGSAGAVLLRAAMPIQGTTTMYERRALAKCDFDLMSGPGKLCQALGIDQALYGTDLLASNSDLRLEPGGTPGNIAFGPRVGIALGRGHDLEWRFVDADQMPFVSRPIRSLRPLESASGS